MILQWTRSILINGRIIEDQGVNIVDKFEALIGNGLASVSMNVGTSQNFGDLRVSANVKTTCNQDEATINTAGQFCFEKALELTIDGFGVLKDLREKDPNLFKA